MVCEQSKKKMARLKKKYCGFSEVSTGFIRDIFICYKYNEQAITINTIMIHQIKFEIRLQLYTINVLYTGHLTTHPLLFGFDFCRDVASLCIWHAGRTYWVLT